ncbi:winged helix-turn-helix domain-containing protein [Pantoea agglomerans]|uniref:winged helix-turn-helix domain-containing protein n=1 Tax=Enterobacter agglomerans TaxID=549 RepID=UPI0013BDF3C5|nr:helix-turn-helix domain-containing protein [Pantoea agglomerans]NEG59760.1 hypothetical protein [Pantoea agglomerans]NEH00910.1 hypothetical protein [Pantoea agglomerans]NEH05298.1 hypothetical protein [Pantoea agglomerans]NEH16326.1 hypothetical protein [Pantoea agglomerans]
MYIIERDVVYDEASDSIWHSSMPDEKTHLPLTASRLLIFFIENKGKIVSRDLILNDIWSRYGAIVSNNTLNQYISLLRKKFEQLGLDSEIIKTITKAGFLLPEDISVEYIDNKIGSTPEIKNKGRVREWKISLFSVTALIIIIVLYKFFWIDNNSETHLYKLGSEGDCNIYMIYSNSAESSKNKLLLARNIISKYANCSGKEMYIFHPSDSLILTQEGPAFLSRCALQKDDNKKLSGCYDVYLLSKK